MLQMSSAFTEASKTSQEMLVVPGTQPDLACDVEAKHLPTWRVFGILDDPTYGLYTPRCVRKDFTRTVVW